VRTCAPLSLEFLFTGPLHWLWGNSCAFSADNLADELRFNQDLNWRELGCFSRQFEIPQVHPRGSIDKSLRNPDRQFTTDFSWRTS
jgi:hypothetical protein